MRDNGTTDSSPRHHAQPSHSSTDHPTDPSLLIRGKITHDGEGDLFSLDEHVLTAW
jgi:hypothetical protein